VAEVLPGEESPQSTVQAVKGRRFFLVALGALALVGGVLVLALNGRSKQPDRIMFDRGGDLYVVAIDDSRTVRLTSTPAQERVPAASLDGRTIAFVRTTQTSGFVFGDIWTMHADGTHRTRLTRGGEDWSPIWSESGHTIYFVRYASGPDGPCGSIFRVGANGRNLERVINAPHFHSFELPAISPDGRRIAFDDWNGCSGGTSGPRLRVIDTSGRPTTDLARLPRNGYYPDPEHDASAWSPDGNRIAFLLNGRLSIANRDGSDLRSVAHSPVISGTWTRPAWSPDGNWVAVVDEGGNLFVLHPDGTGLRRLTQTGWWGTSPAWLPRRTD
jgi:Tol biopolymer transport system component